MSDTTPSSGDATPDNAAQQPAGELVDFESSLDELELLVAQMESGDLSLEDSLQAFERGVALTRSCQQALKTAELRVQALSATGEPGPDTQRPDD